MSTKNTKKAPEQKTTAKQVPVPAPKPVKAPVVDTKENPHAVAEDIAAQVFAEQKTEKKVRQQRNVAYQLGLAKIPKLTFENCSARAAELQGRIDRGEFKDNQELLKLARQWSRWYANKAKQIASQNSKAA